MGALSQAGLFWIIVSGYVVPKGGIVATLHSCLSLPLPPCWLLILLAIQPRWRFKIPLGLSCDRLQHSDIYTPDILFLCVSCAHFYANIFFITSCVCTPFAKRKTRFLLFNRRWSKRLIDIREGNFKNSSETMHNSWIFACDLFLFTIRTRLFSTIIRRREKIQRTCFVNRDDIFLVTRCS